MKNYTLVSIQLNNKYLQSTIYSHKQTKNPFKWRMFSYDDLTINRDIECKNEDRSRERELKLKLKSVHEKRCDQAAGV